MDPEARAWQANYNKRMAAVRKQYEDEIPESS
jgi:hypothetical protein